MIGTPNRKSPGVNPGLLLVLSRFRVLPQLLVYHDSSVSRDSAILPGSPNPRLITCSSDCIWNVTAHYHPVGQHHLCFEQPENQEFVQVDVEVSDVSVEIKGHQYLGIVVIEGPVPAGNPPALKSADRHLGQRAKSFVQATQVYERLIAPFVDVVNGGLAEGQVDGPTLGRLQSVPALVLPPAKS